MAISPKNITNSVAVSIIIPTFNEFKRGNTAFKECLDSIFSQKFPPDKYEVLLVDGGSEDQTLDVASKYPVIFVNNPDRVEEKGRCIGARLAKGNIVGFIDSDDVLNDDQFLLRIIEPFEAADISATQTYFYDYRKNDSFITKYCALIGGDDPIASYFGINDRLCFFNNKWTKFKHEEEWINGYLKVRLIKNQIPAMGSNGFFVRKQVIDQIDIDPFIHTDFIYKMVENGFDTFGLVNARLVHVQKDMLTFFRKKIRRVRRRYSKELNWSYNFNIHLSDIVFVSLYIILFIPILYDTIKGMVRRPSMAWLFHPIACYGLLILYACNSFRVVVKRIAK